MSTTGMAADKAAAPNRLGPRPLPLYLTTAMLNWSGSRLASESLRSGLPAWNPALESVQQDLERQLRDSAEAIAGSGASDNSDEKSAWHDFVAAVDRAILERSQDLLDAIRIYRRHPYAREVEPAPVAWSAGTTTLLDYGTRNLDGPPVLVIPSLINRFYVLDLKSDRSLLRYLEARGFRPFVIDWGRPGDDEARFHMTDYVAGRLEECLDAVRAITGQPPLVLGYCMGGLLALALAARRQQDMRALGLLATPWDFAAGAPPVASFLPLIRPMLLMASDQGRTIGTDLLQALFHMLDPMLVIKKFLRFGELEADGAEAEDFVALEDWLNDGVPLSGPVAAEALLGWYGENLPGRQLWRIAGRTVLPGDINLPSKVIIPSRDRIVSPSSAEPLGELLPHAETLHVPLGHVGMMASTNAKKAVWEPLGAWMEEYAQ
ncbi:alpha/beta fold hydrolase [Nisaea acidiphila]|uniref:Alpha/beta fold hydrolase n=1 Tax=Nisaea acidiphila TaxID=1862145 RepID=A0A9J7AP51_9PROT|nr:alpha/beta fold hydrolase [Nisaea acidiphila]UUX48124.1 alpha/beta fold hydrolase [Nisaea acidiphila]